MGITVVVVVGDVVVVVAGDVVVVDAVVATLVVVAEPALTVVVVTFFLGVTAGGLVVVEVGDEVVVDVAPDADVVEVVAVAAVSQAGTVITLLSRVTAPFWASTRPVTCAPVLRVIEVRARIEPLNSLVVPRVAELPTCQKTWHAWAPFSNTTRLPDAPTKVEPACMMKTEFTSPAPLSVRVPVKERLDADL